jgi:hypothetical protein
MTRPPAQTENIPNYKLHIVGFEVITVVISVGV